MFLRRCSEAKNTQSVRISASTVRYSHEGRPKFLTCQKFIRLITSANTLYTAQEIMHGKAEIHLESKTSQKSDQNHTVHVWLKAVAGRCCGSACLFVPVLVDSLLFRDSAC